MHDDVNNLLREHHQEIKELNRSLKQADRLRKKQERRLARAFDRARRSQCVPAHAFGDCNENGLFKKLGIVLASLLLAMIVIF